MIKFNTVTSLFSGDAAVILFLLNTTAYTWHILQVWQGPEGWRDPHFHIQALKGWWQVLLGNLAWVDLGKGLLDSPAELLLAANEGQLSTR